MNYLLSVVLNTPGKLYQLIFLLVWIRNVCTVNPYENLSMIVPHRIKVEKNLKCWKMQVHSEPSGADSNTNLKNRKQAGGVILSPSVIPGHNLCNLFSKMCTGRYSLQAPRQDWEKIRGFVSNLCLGSNEKMCCSACYYVIN